MTNRFRKAVIEDIVSHGIDENEQSNLLDLFEQAMKSIATTLAREARFDTSCHRRCKTDPLTPR